MKTKANLLWVIICFMVGGSTLVARAPEGQLLDKVIASVDDLPIFYTDLEVEWQLHQAQRSKEEAPTKIQILENMVVDKIFLANAAKKEVHIKNEEVERYLRARMETIMQQVGTEERLEQYLGKSIEVFKNELRKSIREQLTLEHMRHLIIDDIIISPQEVKFFFNHLLPKEVPVCPAMVEAYQIIRYPHTVPMDRYKLEDIRVNILEHGKSFAETAREESEDEATASNGGELGFWKIGQLDPAYEKAALSLKKGEISEVVETPFGFHLIQLIERKKDQYNSRHILIKHRTTKQDPKLVIEELAHIRTDIVAQKLSFEKAVTTYSEDAASVKRRGSLAPEESGVQMPIDQLPKELFYLIDAMEAGEVLEPHLFTTSTGEQAARIIYLKKKVLAHPANLERDYEQIYQLALTKKKQKALEEWLEIAKRKAIIQLDPMYRVDSMLK